MRQKNLWSMEMKRRDFIKVAGVLYVYSLIAKCGAFATAAPRRVIEAVRGGRYPGKIKKLDFKAIAKQGEWRG
jgi:hypothetical protein